MPTMTAPCVPVCSHATPDPAVLRARDSGPSATVTAPRITPHATVATTSQMHGRSGSREDAARLSYSSEQVQGAPSVLATWTDKRGAPRKVENLPAYITYTGVSNVIPGRVVDMSATGVRVELMPKGRASGVPFIELPEQFVLVLRLDRMEVDCQRIWQRDWFVGARFLGLRRPAKDRK